MPAALQGWVDCLLKCKREKNLQQAKHLQALMYTHHLESHPVLASHLVPVLVDCGSLPDARRAFDALPIHHRNFHCWNSLISGYVNHGEPHHALHLFHQMQVAATDCGIQPDRVTYLAVLSACASLGEADKGSAIHAEIVLRGVEQDVFYGIAVVGNKLVDMYGKCGLVADAHKVFGMLSIRNPASWATLIAGYAAHGHEEDTQSCLQQMLSDCIMPPNSILYVCGLKACAAIQALETGRQIHRETVKRGFERELQTGNMLVDMYAKCSSLMEAHQTFFSLQVRDTVSWAAILAAHDAEDGSKETIGNCFHQMLSEHIAPDGVTFVCSLKACAAKQALNSGQEIHSEAIKRSFEIDPQIGNSLVVMYCECGLIGEAYLVFLGLPLRDSVSWNALIAGYANHGLGKEAGKLYQEMLHEGFSPNAFTFVCCLKACGSIVALETGQEIHFEITKRGLEKGLHVGSGLVDMYGKCGLLPEACQVFQGLPLRSDVSWTSMIKAYGINHEGFLAAQCFDDMQEHGVEPSSTTFICLLAACSHSNLISKGQDYFKLLKAQEIDINLDHYASMVDILSRAGHVHEADRFVAAMECPPTCMILHGLLSACKLYGRVELGQQCFQQLIEVNREDASAYLLMEDIYAGVGMWNYVKELEEMRRCTRAGRKPGIALIEINKKLQEFVVGIKKIEDVSDMSDILIARMKYGGYVPNLDFISRQNCQMKETMFC